MKTIVLLFGLVFINTAILLGQCSIDAFGIPTTCNGYCNGIGQVNVTSGTAPYTYQWSTSATTQMITQLCPGVYSVTMTDNTGCTSTATVTVTQPTAINVSVSTTNTYCNGAAYGSATATASGGTPPYTYAWSNGATTSSITSLVAGSYSVTVMDANGCTSSTTASVSQPTALNVSITSQTNVSCYGASDGSLTAFISGGNPPYTYSWSNSYYTPTINNLAAGSYSVTVTDANACTNTASVTISQPPEITSTFTATAIACYGSNFIITYTGSAPTNSLYSWNFNGATIVNGSGAGPYELSWPNPGNYTISLVLSNNGCVSTVTSVTVTNPLPITISYTQTNPSCTNNDGSIDITVSGGTPAYQYLWSYGEITEDISNLPTASYTVTVVDVNGCTVQQSITLASSSQLGRLTGLNKYSGGYLSGGDVELYLFKQSTSGASQMDTAGYLSSANQPWLFNSLLPDTYYLKANLLNPTAFPTLLNSYYDSTYSWTDAVPIAINCDDSIDVVFNMYEVVSSAGGNGTISGTINSVGSKSTKAAGDPVVGAEVFIEQNPNNVPLQVSITDSQGKYRFTGLTAGSGYFLVVDIPGFPTLSTYENITISDGDSITNLNFLVDSAAQGGIFIDNSSGYNSVSNAFSAVEVFPNPVIDNIDLKISLPAKTNVVVEIYDETGKLIQTKNLGVLQEGTHQVKINTSNQSSGINYMMIKSGNERIIKKLIIK